MILLIIDIPNTQLWWILPFGILCGLIGWLIHKSKNHLDLKEWNRLLESKSKAHRELAHKFDILTKSSTRQINGLLAEIKTLKKGQNGEFSENLSELSTPGGSDEELELETVSSISERLSHANQEVSELEEIIPSEDHLRQENDRLRLINQKLSKVPQALYLEKINSLKSDNKRLREKSKKSKNKLREQEENLASYEKKLAKLQQKIRSLRSKKN